MNFFKRLSAVFYMAVMVGTGALFLAVALNLIVPEFWLEIINSISANFSYQAAAAVIGFLFVILGIVYPYRMEKRIKKNRIVAFQNPDGEVTVSLSAIEDYVRKIAKNILGIKDLRSRVDINKRGINIITDVSMFSGANIPEVTEKIQMEVRNKVQSMLGIEKKINIKMHIRKIESKTEPSSGAMNEEMTGAMNVPYREIG
ncbi:MAG: alkaline shock response membrane anchor protein AmaP [Candidatus Omnitrophota bacterium]